MECSNCHQPLDSSARFCSKCGKSVPVSTATRCKQCWAEIAVDASFCSVCATKTSEAKIGISTSRAKEWRRFFEEVKWSKTQTPKELQRVKEYLAKGDLGWADRALVEAGFKLPMDTDPFETIFFMVWILSRMKDLPVPLKYVSLKDADTGREEWKSVFVAATRCKMLLVSSPPVSTILQTTKRVPKGTFAFSYTDLTETRMSPQHL